MSKTEQEIKKEKENLKTLVLMAFCVGAIVGIMLGLNMS